MWKSDQRTTKWRQGQIPIVPQLPSIIGRALRLCFAHLKCINKETISVTSEYQIMYVLILYSQAPTELLVSKTPSLKFDQNALPHSILSAARDILNSVT